MRSAWFTVLLALLLLPAAAQAADLAFTTSDGVHLHIIEAGPRDAQTIVFVPGWTMPAWIFKPQIDYFSQRYHVVALDPRGQGYSEVPAGGYNYLRRGQDIRDLLAALGNKPVLLVGWSLGVLDSLSYVNQFGDGHLAGMVLIDNSVGEDPPPPIVRHPPARRGPVLTREAHMRQFVASMFHVPPGTAYIDALTEATLNTPPEAAAQLANYAVARTYWKQAVLSVRHPILYVVRPVWAAQAANLALHHPDTEIAVFDRAGHALFVDEAPRFDLLMAQFIKQRVWP
jgi:microsomal epoxide hydrolase